MNIQSQVSRGIPSSSGSGLNYRCHQTFRCTLKTKNAARLLLSCFSVTGRTPSLLAWALKPAVGTHRVRMALAHLYPKVADTSRQWQVETHQDYRGHETLDDARSCVFVWRCGAGRCSDRKLGLDVTMLPPAFPPPPCSCVSCVSFLWCGGGTGASLLLGRHSPLNCPAGCISMLGFKWGTESEQVLC
jgi:hypothetical protein